jgi:PAS domain-containing protein
VAESGYPGPGFSAVPRAKRGLVDSSRQRRSPGRPRAKGRAASAPAALPWGALPRRRDSTGHRPGPCRKPITLRRSATSSSAASDPPAGRSSAAPCTTLLGTSLADLLQLDDGHLLGDGLARTVATRRPTTIVARVLHRDGHWLRFETSARPISDPGSGAVSEFQAACRDVTERVSAAEALRASELDVRALAGAAPGWRGCRRACGAWRPPWRGVPGQSRSRARGPGGRKTSG